MGTARTECRTPGETALHGHSEGEQGLLYPEHSESPWSHLILVLQTHISHVAQPGSLYHGTGLSLSSACIWCPGSAPVRLLPDISHRTGV